MNQAHPQPRGTTNDAIDKSFWHMTLRLHEACEAAERRVVEVEHELVTVKQQRDAAQQRERELLIRVLVAHGTSADVLQDRSLVELQRLVAATE